jgi:AraC family transcriptional regulator, regulatory protein of adaptative response / methylated-DNA-[protein]-cysteine methyltransferase
MSTVVQYECSPNPATTSDDPRWLAVLARDWNVDGSFYYSVRTTGVYCRPSCGSRHAQPANVRFHSSCAEAEAAGFRPCKRCRPDQPSQARQAATLITELCRWLETTEWLPSLHDLAQRSGLSPAHLHRTFKQVTGLSPRAYALASRAERVRSALAQQQTVTDAAFNAGFNSSGRFYAAATPILGMTPTDYRAGGTRQLIRFAVGECTLGSILVASTELGVCAIMLGDDPEALVRDLQDRFPHAEFLGGDVEYEQTVATVIGLVEAPRLGLDLPLDIRGTAFQQRVWQALQIVPPGTTVSYSEIAERIGEPRAYVLSPGRVPQTRSRSRSHVIA